MLRDFFAIFAIFILNIRNIIYFQPEHFLSNNFIYLLFRITITQTSSPSYQFFLVHNSQSSVRMKFKLSLMLSVGISIISEYIVLLRRKILYILVKINQIYAECISVGRV